MVPTAYVLVCIHVCKFGIPVLVCHNFVGLARNIHLLCYGKLSDVGLGILASIEYRKEVWFVKQTVPGWTIHRTDFQYQSALWSPS